MDLEAPPVEQETKPPETSAPGAPAVAPSALRAWVINHDDSWIFIVLYVGAGVLLSLWLGLFWLAAVVGVHAAFEWVRQTHITPPPRRLPWRVAWEIKLDLALVILALAMAVYLDFVLGLAGLGGASRLGVVAGARVAGRGARALVWMRVLRGFLLTVDDLSNVAVRAVAFVCRRGRCRPVVADAALDASGHPAAPWSRWCVADHIAIWLGLACLALIAAAPLILPDESFGSVLGKILEELRPIQAE
jgi:hypothetical protein